MKPQLTGTKKRLGGIKPSGAEAALCFQEELVAAIHGAFEVAVEIAVREVRKLVGQTAGDIYEDLRRENESLKQRLQRAEALLDSALTEGSPAPPPPDQVFNATNHEDQQTHPGCDQMSPNLEVGEVHSCPGVRGNSPSAGHQSKHVSRDEEQGPRSDASSQCTSDAAPEQERNNAGTKEVTQDVSHAFEVKVESTNRLCQDPEALQCDSPPLQFRFEQVKVKQEKPEEEQDGSSCCYDSIKVEDFSVECMSAVQSQMLEEWNPEVPHIQSQDPNTRLSTAGLNEVHPSNSTTSLPPSTDLPSLSPDFPSLFQLRDLAPISEAPPQIYGVHVRTGRNTSHVITTPYSCKFCGQTFHLPSLLRRHYGQCQQRLQQRCQQPVAGSNRTRLQLYPPGCSPFRCTECNREFNRMENLKTHLRIHTGERPYTCSVCSKCFRHSGALTRHFRIHTGEKPYICGQCGKSFRNCGGLKFHQRSHSKQLQ